MKTIESIFINHSTLCDHVYNLLLEENSLLKKSNQLPDNESILKKKSLLPDLDSSLMHLRTISSESISRNDYLKDLLKSIQNKMMKIFFLTRENEQLILKISIPNNFKVIPPKLPPHQFASKIKTTYTV